MTPDVTTAQLAGTEVAVAAAQVAPVVQRATEVRGEPAVQAAQVVVARPMRGQPMPPGAAWMGPCR